MECGISRGKVQRHLRSPEKYCEAGSFPFSPSTPADCFIMTTRKRSYEGTAVLGGAVLRDEKYKALIKEQNEIMKKEEELEEEEEEIKTLNCVCSLMMLLWTSDLYLAVLCVNVWVGLWVVWLC